MKKRIIVVAVAFMMSFSGCGNNDTYEIGITLSPDEIEVGGYQEELDYSDAEISPTGDKIIVYATQSLGDALIVIIPVDEKGEDEYQGTYITPGMPVEFEVEKGVWYKIGVAKYNDTDTEKSVYVNRL